MAFGIDNCCGCDYDPCETPCDENPTDSLLTYVGVVTAPSVPDAYPPDNDVSQSFGTQSAGHYFFSYCQAGAYYDQYNYHTVFDIFAAHNATGGWPATSPATFETTLTDDFDTQEEAEAQCANVQVLHGGGDIAIRFWNLRTENLWNGTPNPSFALYKITPSVRIECIRSIAIWEYLGNTWVEVTARIRNNSTRWWWRIYYDSMFDGSVVISDTLIHVPAGGYVDALIYKGPLSDYPDDPLWEDGVISVRVKDGGSVIDTLEVDWTAALVIDTAEVWEDEDGVKLWFKNVGLGVVDHVTYELLSYTGCSSPTWVNNFGGPGLIIHLQNAPSGICPGDGYAQYLDLMFTRTSGTLSFTVRITCLNNGRSWDLTWTL